MAGDDPSWRVCGRDENGSGLSASWIVGDLAIGMSCRRSYSRLVHGLSSFSVQAATTSISRVTYLVTDIRINLGHRARSLSLFPMVIPSCVNRTIITFWIETCRRADLFFIFIPRTSRVIKQHVGQRLRSKLNVRMVRVTLHHPTQVSAAVARQRACQ